jgi:hypothetical protein
MERHLGEFGSAPRNHNETQMSGASHPSKRRIGNCTCAYPLVLLRASTPRGRAVSGTPLSCVQALVQLVHWKPLDLHLVLKKSQVSQHGQRGIHLNFSRLRRFSVSRCQVPRDKVLLQPKFGATYKFVNGGSGGMTHYSCLSGPGF